MTRQLLFIAAAIALSIVIKLASNHLFLASQPVPYRVSSGQPSSAEEAMLTGHKLDINKASKRELELLPGIGPKIAGKIIGARDALGGFSRIEDVKKVKGIGEKKFAVIRQFFDAK
jgi:competence protein ComEA